ncbi:MAG TPA: hypothetical protein VGI40_22610 [Pirellulaceae bacterium]|jgi:hypothetical protein
MLFSARLTGTSLLALVSSVFISCSQGPAEGTVTGEVTFDGQPVKAGHVLFTPVDGNGQTGGGTIRDGKLEAKNVPAGKMKVELHGNKVVGKRKAYDTPESPWEDDIAELLPPKYNSKSDLTLEVKRGTQDVKYELKSK